MRKKRKKDIYFQSQKYFCAIDLSNKQFDRYKKLEKIP